MECWRRAVVDSGAGSRHGGSWPGAASSGLLRRGVGGRRDALR